MNHTSRRISCVFISGIALIAVVCSTGASSAAAASQPEVNSRSSGGAKTQDVDINTAPKGAFKVTLTRSGASGYRVVCEGAGKKKQAVNDPHPSKGAKGAIYKTRVECHGHGLSSINLRVRGLLRFAASKDPDNTDVKFHTRAKSLEHRHVTVNGASETFYTPREGKNGGHGTGFWRATSTWMFNVNGHPSTVGSQTKTAWKKI